MLIYVILTIFFVWLIILTRTVLKTKDHYNNLTSNTKKYKLDEILDQLLVADKKTKEELEVIEKSLNEEIKASTLHIQKIGLIRFSPFGRSDGDKSFVISFLNFENSGIVINFIQTRDGLRVYSKKIVHGKSQEFELSEEEKKVIIISN